LEEVNSPLKIQPNSHQKIRLICELLILYVICLMKIRTNSLLEILRQMFEIQLMVNYHILT
jgi:hypothetical protein